MSVERPGAHLRTFALIAATIVLAVLIPARALATPLDTSSDRAALTAYEHYMTSLDDGIGAANRRDQAFAASVQKGCAGVLTLLTSGQAHSSAVHDLGEEIGDDVAVAFDAEAIQPFTRFSSTLARLRWSSGATANTTAALIAATRASLAIKPSTLCADAQAVASAPASEPARTRTFLAVYVPAARAASKRLAAFLGVLERFETSSEAGLIAAVNRLVTRYESASKADQDDGSAQIINVLDRTAYSRSTVF
ncbi:MAG: hypothetical protein ACLP0J_18100 [Solirubrobacteraceae bacterium]|jgi:hypothetical protein